METRQDEAGTAPAFRLQEADVVLEAFADETIAVNLGTGRYYSLDLAGAEILDLLVGGFGIPPIAAHMAVRYDADPAMVEAAVTAFADRLLEEGLICPASDGPSDAGLPAPVPSSASFSGPTLSVYSDMEDLLLLDPVHDVDETGWPVRADSTDSDPAGPRSSG